MTIASFHDITNTIGGQQLQLHEQDQPATVLELNRIDPPIMANGSADYKQTQQAKLSGDIDSNICERVKNWNKN